MVSELEGRVRVRHFSLKLTMMLTYFGDKNHIHLHSGEPEADLHRHIESLRQRLFDMAPFDCRLGETLEYVNTINYKNETVPIRYIPASFRFKILESLIHGKKKYSAEDQFGKRWNLRLSQIKKSYQIGVRSFNQSDWLLISATPVDQNTVYYNVWTNYESKNPELTAKLHVFKNSGLLTNQEEEDATYIFDVASKL